MGITKKLKNFFSDDIAPYFTFSKSRGAVFSAMENFCNHDFFEEHKKGRHIGYFDLDKKAKDITSPLNPWAFIRVKDEEKTLKASLYSILGAIQRGVIAYHDITDNSEKIILEFCEKFHNFKPYHYPYTINIRNPKTPEEHLYHFYNFTLSKIPKNEWLIKIDTDHIYDSKRLFKGFYTIKNKMHVLSIPRVDFAIRSFAESTKGGGHILVRADHINTNHQCDHWLIYNEDLIFEPWISSNNNILEILRFKKPYTVFISELNNWHFPFQKPQRRECFAGFQWLELDEFKKQCTPAIDLQMLDEKYIRSHLEFMDLC